MESVDDDDNNDNNIKYESDKIIAQYIHKQTNKLS